MKGALIAIVLAVAALAACADRAYSLGPSTLRKTSHATESDDDGATNDTAAPDPTPSAAAVATDVGPTIAPAIDPFANAPAFTELTPAKQSAAKHATADGSTSNAGKNCMSCHGPNMGAPPFALAGTIQQSKTNAAAATGVQVRIVDAAGNPIALVGTDDSGNFWFPSTTALPAGARVGIRDASDAQTMSAPVNVGACNQSACHSKDRPIFLAN